MSTLLVLKYPLDPTGVSPNNLITREPHKTTPGKKRIIVPNHGLFFTDSIKVFNRATGKELSKNDFRAIEYCPIPSQRFGKPIHSLVMIVNSTITGNEFDITYQALGGEFSTTSNVIKDMYDRVMTDTRPPSFPEILDRPDRYTPAPHLSDLGDVFGFEYLTHAIDMLRQAVLLGDIVSHDEIYAHLSDINTGLTDAINRVNDALTAHALDKENPHEVTKSQVGLSEIPNSISHKRDINSNETLATSKSMYDHIRSNDHDDQYVKQNGDVPINMRIRANKLEVEVGGAYRQIWPPTWQ